LETLPIYTKVGAIIELKDIFDLLFFWS